MALTNYESFIDNDGNIELYHVCNKDKLIIILEKGFVSGDGRRAWKSYSVPNKRYFDWSPYNWYRDKMIQYIKKPKKALQYPVWLYFNNPIDRGVSFGNKEEILLTIRIPIYEVLFSNLSLWGGCVLNYQPIVDESVSLLNDEYFDDLKTMDIELYHRSVLDTYSKIFDVSLKDSIKNDSDMIQGTTWILKKEMVVKVEEII